MEQNRHLYIYFSGNFVLVGPIGSHLGTLCKLALHVANIPIHNIDTKKRNTFFDGLRSAVRLTGAEGKRLTVFLTVSIHI
jgi:dynein heavy chain